LLSKLYKKIYGYFFKKSNEDLLKYVKGLEEQVKRNPQYTTLKIPDGEKLQLFLADIGKSDYMMFYLHCIENELIGGFINGKESDIYKGGLKVVNRIKTDIIQAVKSEKLAETRKENEA